MRKPEMKWSPPISIKGFQVGKGEYLQLEPEELEAIAIESKCTIEIDEFVPRKEIDELYQNNPYYIVPDGDWRHPGLDRMTRQATGPASTNSADGSDVGITVRHSEPVSRSTFNETPSASTMIGQSMLVSWMCNSSRLMMLGNGLP